MSRSLFGSRRAPARFVPATRVIGARWSCAVDVAVDKNGPVVGKTDCYSEERHGRSFKALVASKERLSRPNEGEGSGGAWSDDALVAQLRKELADLRKEHAASVRRAVAEALRGAQAEDAARREAKKKTSKEWFTPAPSQLQDGRVYEDNDGQDLDFFAVVNRRVFPLKAANSVDPDDSKEQGDRVVQWLTTEINKNANYRCREVGRVGEALKANLARL